MSSRRHDHRQPRHLAQNNAAGSTGARRRFLGLAAVLGLAIVGTATGLILLFPGGEVPPTKLSALVSEVAASKPPASAATNVATPAIRTSKVGLPSLRGRWLRADGDYVLEIRGIDNNGKLDAGYYNPNPIRVSRAEGTREGAVTKALIELQDAGYPGCTYTLAYDPPSDRLRGTYFQAALRETYDVEFERIK